MGAAKIEVLCEDDLIAFLKKRFEYGAALLSTGFGVKSSRTRIMRQEQARKEYGDKRQRFFVINGLHLLTVEGQSRGEGEVCENMVTSYHYTFLPTVYTS